MTPMPKPDRSRFAAAVRELQESIAARRRLPIDSPEHGLMLERQIELSAEIRRLAELLRREAGE
jgi:predicted ATPase